MNDVPGRHPSGVRIAGDDYQHLVTWNEVLLGLRPGSGVTNITVEAPDSGNVDDVVVEYEHAPTAYSQVKHAVDAATPVGTRWLTTPPRSGRPSLLARFHSSWEQLRSDDGHPVMQLLTDREIDASDPIMRLLDRRTELLVPSIQAVHLPAAASAAREEWAEHLGVAEGELIAMLAALRLRTGRPYNAEAERAESLMWGHGLATGRAAVESGIALVREWVQQRWRARSLDELRELVAERIEHATDPGALLVVEAIDDDPHPEDATELLRWVERYDGEDPNLRRQLTDPADWQGVIHPELEAVADRLRAAGHRRVLVRGALRLPLWFSVGAALRHVRGFDVAGFQHGHIWASDTATGAPPAARVHTVQCGDGADLAIAVAVATDPTTAVRRHIAEHGLPVGDLLILTPPAGPGPEAIADGPAAARLAVGLRDAVRQKLEEHPAERIHLFIAAPGALALLVGHRWNAMRPTIVYEHLGSGAGYAPTLNVPA